MVTRQGFRLEFDRLSKDQKKQVRNDFEKILGWGYFTFSKKKNGVYKLQPAEIIYVERYFDHLKK